MAIDTVSNSAAKKGRKIVLDLLPVAPSYQPPWNSAAVLSHF